MALESILLGRGEYYSWQNQKHKKGISSGKEGDELYNKYLRCELWLPLKQIPLLYELELALEAEIKVRSDGQMITEARLWKIFLNSIKGKYNVTMFIPNVTLMNLETPINRFGSYGNIHLNMHTMEIYIMWNI